MKLALGIFDGVHIGHCKVIERAHRVLTLHPHPTTAAHLLTTLAERKALINNLDVLKYTPALGKLSPEEFVRDILVKKFRPESVFVGEDYAFGYNRTGNTALLKALGQKYGFSVEVVPEVIIKGKPVRSSLIRHLLSKGNIEDAAALLGRDYSVSGSVVRGKGVGRELGFPTVNLHTDENKLIPAPGVYAGHIIVNNTYHPCAINIGERRIGHNAHIELEAYILNFSADVYGKRVTLFFEKFLRTPKQFKNHKALAAQIKKDVQRIEKIFS